MPSNQPSSVATQAASERADRRIVYMLDLEGSPDAVVVHLATEERGPDGTWSAPQPGTVTPRVWAETADTLDREIAEMLTAAAPGQLNGSNTTDRFVVAESGVGPTLRLICISGRCRLASDSHEATAVPVRWDDGAPWEFLLRIARDGERAHQLSGALRRGDEEMPLSAPDKLHATGLLLREATLSRFDHDGAFALALALRAEPVLPLHDGAWPAAVSELFAKPQLPEVTLADGSAIPGSLTEPVVRLGIDAQGTRSAALLALEFQYGAVRVPAGSDPGLETVLDRHSRTFHHRRIEMEEEALRRLESLGARRKWHYVHGDRLVIARAKLPSLVLELVRSGWQVEMEGVALREPGTLRASVRSGIDWFDLHGAVSYGDLEVPLADVLEARRRGQDSVMLSDGSLGLLPMEWMARLGPLAAGGKSKNGFTRFGRSQLAILDVLLATLPEVDVDATFERARTELQNFDRIEPSDPPDTFTGTLREYQRAGLGWLHFLRRFGLGGCLADDMGLGKTVQVLALLEARRRDGGGPSIVVVPRSLLFNWHREAERFTPALRVLDFTGTARHTAGFDPSTTDVVLTTYGTLRRDIPLLVETEFDYAILDEAQAIKNPTTASAKASRLLRARYRLALTGTPIENRIEELWSLFEFLNPGMLGAASNFSLLAQFAGADAPADEPGAGSSDERTAGRVLLARALRPVILRRTKAEVATDLPERIEQTLEVELDDEQRAFYDTIREQYRRSVLERVDRDGLGRSHMHILEALLRLRQAACHPVLANPAAHALPSAKLDALIPSLEELAAEGHKTLVFSQFTSFLALVRERLEAIDMPYEYLDGQVRDREARVTRFQEDANCPVFLVSLRAGGQGLNLTAADYVFILDPWWNPAVEAQAIDRAHRIGQTRRVIATRLVARGTIEEKILELQNSKRALADAILSADEGVLAGIGREELELLLG
jgi:superfamily II DNA or RNA helicase